MMLARRSAGGGQLALFFKHVFLDAKDEHQPVLLEPGMDPYAPDLAERIDRAV